MVPRLAWNGRPAPTDEVRFSDERPIRAQGVERRPCRRHHRQRSETRHVSCTAA